MPVGHLELKESLSILSCLRIELKYLEIPWNSWKLLYLKNQSILSRLLQTVVPKAATDLTLFLGHSVCAIILRVPGSSHLTQERTVLIVQLSFGIQTHYCALSQSNTTKAPHPLHKMYKASRALSTFFLLLLNWREIHVTYK